MILLTVLVFNLIHVLFLDEMEKEKGEVEDDEDKERSDTPAGM